MQVKPVPGSPLWQDSGSSIEGGGHAVETKATSADAGNALMPASGTPTADEGLPFAGLRVLDVGTFIAAPAAAVVLADFGADVIKVEQPGAGDPNRVVMGSHAYPKSHVNYPWEMDARNKRSIALDLKHAGGRAVLERLIARADVLITNFPVPVRERMRLRWEDVSPANPRLVYASLTGYGEGGADRDLPGFDSTAYFARSGFLETQRHEGQPPHFSLPASGDRATAMALVAAIVTALYLRERSGLGMQVGTSLLASGIWSNGVHVQAALLDAYLAPRPPRERPRSALGNSYRTRDGRWFMLALAVEEHFWPPLCRALGRPELERDPRFHDTPSRRANAAALTAILDAAFAEDDWAAWRDRLSAARIVHGGISRLEDVVGDAQARAAGAIVPTDSEEMPFTVASPMRIGEAVQRRARRAPRVGEHTDEILGEAGFDGDGIARLRAQGAVA